MFHEATVPLEEGRHIEWLQSSRVNGRRHDGEIVGYPR
jgi:hypothetical protein